MSRIIYDPRIPTSRKIVPSQYQRLRRSRSIILTLGINTSEFMAAMKRAADSMARVMREMADG
jgi:hypothetical protein